MERKGLQERKSEKLFKESFLLELNTVWRVNISSFPSSSNQVLLVSSSSSSSSNQVLLVSSSSFLFSHKDRWYSLKLLKQERVVGDTFDDEPSGIVFRTQIYPLLYTIEKYTHQY